MSIHAILPIIGNYDRLCRKIGPHCMTTQNWLHISTYQTKFQHIRQNQRFKHWSRERKLCVCVLLWRSIWRHHVEIRVSLIFSFQPLHWEEQTTLLHLDVHYELPNELMDNVYYLMYVLRLYAPPLPSPVTEVFLKPITHYHCATRVSPKPHTGYV